MTCNDSTRIRNTIPTHDTFRQKGSIPDENHGDTTYALALFSPNTPAQDPTHLNLPEGAIARLGKGSVDVIQYSPDGTQLALVSSIGIWLYDTTTNREVALLTGHTARVVSVAFSTDGKMLASASYDGTMLLWKVAD